MKLFKSKNNDETIVGHLTEVRMRLILSILAFLITTIVVFQYTEPLVNDLISKSSGMQFVFIEPAELFITFMKIAITGGLVVALPFLLFQLWMFIRPGLNKKERQALTIALTIGLLLFVLGMVFAYLLVLPMTTRFFMGFKLADIPPMISFSSYFNYALNIILSFGLAFEFPILMVMLAFVGIIRTSFLAKNRKYVLLIVLIVAAIITPPDVVSQVLLTIPLMLLFELGLIFSRLVEKKGISLSTIRGKESDEKEPEDDKEDESRADEDTESTDKENTNDEISTMDSTDVKSEPERITDPRKDLLNKVTNGNFLNPDDQKF